MFFNGLFKVIRGLLLLILIILLLFNLYTIFENLVMKNDLPKVFGYSRVVIISGSMQPEIEVGDLIIIKQEEHYAVGDIVTFRSGQRLITHRIIDIVDGKAITRGDFNNVADADPVDMSEIEGKAVFIISKAGGIILFLRSPLGLIVLTVSAFLLIELPYVFSRRKGNEKDKDEQK